MHTEVALERNLETVRGMENGPYLLLESRQARPFAQMTKASDSTRAMGHHYSEKLFFDKRRKDEQHQQDPIAAIDWGKLRSANVMPQSTNCVPRGLRHQDGVLLVTATWLFSSWM